MRLRRSDKILILVIVAVIAVLYIAQYIFFGVFSGNTVEVRLDGKLVGTYKLSEDRKEVFKDENGHYNIMVIEAGRVCISEADCPDRHCVNKGYVSKGNETIICLPHKLVLKVVDRKPGGPDVVAE